MQFTTRFYCFFVVKNQFFHTSILPFISYYRSWTRRWHVVETCQDMPVAWWGETTVVHGWGETYRWRVVGRRRAGGASLLLSSSSFFFHTFLSWHRKVTKEVKSIQLLGRWTLGAAPLLFLSKQFGGYRMMFVGVFIIDTRRYYETCWWRVSTHLWFIYPSYFCRHTI